MAAERAQLLSRSDDRGRVTGPDPTVDVMFAAFSASPAIPVSAGNVMNVPPPAIALTTAARSEASISSRSVLA